MRGGGRRTKIIAALASGGVFAIRRRLPLARFVAHRASSLAVRGISAVGGRTSGSFVLFAARKTPPTAPVKSAVRTKAESRLRRRCGRCPALIGDDNFDHYHRSAVCYRVHSSRDRAPETSRAPKDSPSLSAFRIKSSSRSRTPWAAVDSLSRLGLSATMLSSGAA